LDQSLIKKSKYPKGSMHKLKTKLRKGEINSQNNSLLLPNSHDKPRAFSKSPINSVNLSDKMSEEMKFSK